jgi:hypothetical protein
MVRKLRLAALGSLVAAGLLALLVMVVGGAYYAVRQVRPFYEQALRIEPEVLQRSSRELESRATALYSDATQQGTWQALFTAEQINGWLATQLSENANRTLPKNLRDPRVAIAPDVLTLGFRTTSGGVDTVVTVDSTVFLTEEGAVGIRFQSVRAGALPLPVLPLADQLAAACKELKLPARWTQQDGQPVAIVEVQSDLSSEKRQFYIDSIELGDGELYVAGHTELARDTEPGPKVAGPRQPKNSGNEIELTEYVLTLTPSDKKSALKIARRATNDEPKKLNPPKRQPSG